MKQLKLIFVGAMAVGLAFAGLGCNQPNGQPANNPDRVVVLPPGKDQPKVGKSTEFVFDECSDRVQNLCGALTNYYRAKQRFPVALEDLKPYGFVGEDLVLTCPASGKPYQYASSGLEAPGQDITIYIYDAEPSHADERWCGVVKKGATSGALGLFVEHIPESKFKMFLPVAPVQTQSPNVQDIKPVPRH
jgi:hypothetical protein